MERRMTQERSGANARRSRGRHIPFAAVAACIFALPAARAQAQQPPASPDLSAGEVSDRLPDIARVPGGWTAETVARRVQRSSFDVAAKEASLRVAEARVAAAVVAFFPRLSGSRKRSSAQRRAAEEACHARRDSFRVGKGTSVELADAEAKLFRARFAAVSARIDQRIARMHIDHATGRDVAGRAS
jgi:outer membrane protein TolC